jgi:hypothetical protein
MSNIQECTELSHIPVSVWAEKLLLWKTEHEHETALKRANKNISSFHILSDRPTALQFALVFSTLDLYTKGYSINIVIYE